MEGKNSGLGQSDMERNPALPLASCVVLDMLFNLSEPRFPPL